MWSSLHRITPYLNCEGHCAGVRRYAPLAFPQRKGCHSCAEYKHGQDGPCVARLGQVFFDETDGHFGACFSRVCPATHCHSPEKNRFCVFANNLQFIIRCNHNNCVSCNHNKLCQLLFYSSFLHTPFHWFEQHKRCERIFTLKNCVLSLQPNRFPRNRHHVEKVTFCSFHGNFFPDSTKNKLIQQQTCL